MASCFDFAPTVLSCSTSHAFMLALLLSFCLLMLWEISCRAFQLATVRSARYFLISLRTKQVLRSWTTILRLIWLSSELRAHALTGIVCLRRAATGAESFHPGELPSSIDKWSLAYRTHQPTKTNPPKPTHYSHPNRHHHYHHQYHQQHTEQKATWNNLVCNSPQMTHSRKAKGQTIAWKIFWCWCRHW